MTLSNAVAILAVGSFIRNSISFEPKPHCSLPEDKGRVCNFSTLEQSQKTMFHFDHSRNCCSEFTHLGCGGNQNKFLLLRLCLKDCLTDESSEEQSDSYEDYSRNDADCLLKPDPGPCRALIPMWFYDTETKSCQQFSYGGCQGNGNLFDDEEGCTQFCSGVTENSTLPRPHQKGLCTSPSLID